MSGKKPSEISVATVNALRSKLNILGSVRVIHPSSVVALSDSGVTGVLNGTYSYATTFYTPIGETDDSSLYATISVVNKKVDISNIPISLDSTVLGRRIYRTVGNPADPTFRKLLVDINNNIVTTYQDNIADGDLGVAEKAINTTGEQLKSNSDVLMQIGESSFSIGKGNGVLGYANTAVGNYAMAAVIDAYRCVAVGLYSQFMNQYAGRVTSVGIHSANDNVSGNDIVAVGYGATHFNTASDITAIGSMAAELGVSGSGITAIGMSSVHQNIIGNGITSVGHHNLFDCLDDYNTSTGYLGLYKLQNGKHNISMGSNTAILVAAGNAYNVNCNKGIYIGDDIRVSADGNTNEIVIGDSAIGNGSNTATIGNSSITKTVLRGDIGVDVVAPISKLHLLKYAGSANDATRTTPIDVISIQCTHDTSPYTGFGGRVKFIQQIAGDPNVSVGYFGVVAGATYATESDMVWGLRVGGTVAEKMRLNVTGLTIAGQLLSYGANDSGGSGYRMVVVPNI